ncbi:hypothetical protein V8E53_000105 [Lactarius tabidus]
MSLPIILLILTTFWLSLPHAHNAPQLHRQKLKQRALPKSPRAPRSALPGSILARIPCTRLLSDLIAGDLFSSSAAGLLALIPKFFDKGCPNRFIIGRGAFNLAHLGHQFPRHGYISQTTEDRRVELKECFGRVFGFWYVILLHSSLTLSHRCWGILAIWKDFSIFDRSPILAYFS